MNELRDPAVVADWQTLSVKGSHATLKILLRPSHTHPAQSTPPMAMNALQLRALAGELMALADKL